MSIPVQENEKIPLRLDLQCYQGGTYYVEARVEQKDGTLISAIDLTDQGGGKFRDDSLSMPNLTLVYAYYRVYLDAAKTTEASLYCGPYEDVFSLSTDKIIVSNQTDLHGVLETSALLDGNIQDDATLNAVVTDEEVTANVETSELTAKIENEELRGVTNEC